ncbi:MAG TPA: thioredoxin domain-containing protein [Chitinophagaceae bacterium]|nr:thioredoxin domain-containing protein [Chitinophagaceae bacterium]
MAFKKNVVEIIPTKNIYVGRKDAPVTVLMYGDYEDEASAKANEAVKKLLEEYPDEVRFNFRHFPQTQIHQKAMKAAEASLAAAQEGKFWEMHNRLFERRRSLGTISLKEYAREVGVTNKKLLDELVSSKYSWHVREDQLEAWDLGLRSVPVFFINGEELTESPRFENLRKAVEKELQKRA